jgi:hypothetical protein
MLTSQSWNRKGTQRDIWIIIGVKSALKCPRLTFRDQGTGSCHSPAPSGRFTTGAKPPGSEELDGRVVPNTPAV